MSLTPSYSVPLSQGSMIIERPATPAPGAGFYLVVPNHTRWLIQTVMFSLTTDANVANRRPTPQWYDTTGLWFQQEPNGTQAASLTRYWFFRPDNGIAVTTIAGNIYASLPPPFVMLPNHRIQFTIADIQAGDQVDNIRVLLYRWVERNV
jgi:hypothetical protein